MRSSPPWLSAHTPRVAGSPTRGASRPSRVRDRRRLRSDTCCVPASRVTGTWSTRGVALLRRDPLLLLTESTDGGPVAEHTLGADLGADHRPQVIVPAGPGRPPARWVPGHWSGAPSPPASSSRASSWRHRAGRRERPRFAAPSRLSAACRAQRALQRGPQRVAPLWAEGAPRRHLDGLDVDR